MRTLDSDLIIDLQRAAMQTEEENKVKTLGQCLLFAVKPIWREGIVLVSNRHFLIEWPIELVDTTAPEYRHILKAANLVPAVAEGLKQNRWDNREGMRLKDESRLFDCEEVEPHPVEKLFAYKTLPQGPVYYFSRFYRAVLDTIWPAAEIGDELVPAVDLKLYIPAANQKRGYLLFYEGGRRRGILANSIVGTDP